MENRLKLSPISILRVFERQVMSWLSALALAVIAMTLAACSDDPEVTPPEDKTTIYIQSNNPEANQNSIIAYEVGADGKATLLSGSPFLTGGTGLANPQQALGPNDLDVPMVVNGNILYAVNSGSNTIAAMTINSNGTLSAITGSPFASGGENPVSVAIKGSNIYVVNKAQDPIMGNITPPSYIVYQLAADGKISPAQVDAFTTTVGSSPSYAYIPSGSSLMFGTDFLGFMTIPPVGTLRSFVIAANGTIEPAPGTPQMLPVMGGALGLLKHPTADILYVGFPVTGEIGVYGINPSTGELTYQSKVASGAAACWSRANQAGNKMYTLNSSEATVAVHDISNAASPTLVQKLDLKLKGPLYTAPTGMQVYTSQPFHIELDEKFAYVVSQRTNPNPLITEGNYFHVLKIQADGTLVEETEPVAMPVPSTARPQGIVIRE
jgi:6-phosphogluconolactonase (cycloisomerase 2 family)